MCFPVTPDILHQILWLVAHQKWRPPVPEGCPPALADLMQRCWQDDARARWGQGERGRQDRRGAKSWRDQVKDGRPASQPSCCHPCKAS